MLSGTLSLDRVFSLADSHLCSDIRNPLNDDNNDGLGLECL